MTGDAGFTLMAMLAPTPTSLVRIASDGKIAWLQAEVNRERERSERLFDALRKIESCAPTESGGAHFALTNARQIARVALEEDAQ
jgi:hypothetical protein